MPDFIQNEGISMAKTINMRRNAATQAALDGAARVLAGSPYVRHSEKGEDGYVLLDVVRLSLKALARFIPFLDREHPGWEGQSAGETEPRRPHIHFARTEEVERYLNRATSELMRGSRRGELIPDSTLVRLALTVVALYGDEFNKVVPTWQVEELA